MSTRAARQPPRRCVRGFLGGTFRDQKFARGVSGRDEVCRRLGCAATGEARRAALVRRIGMAGPQGVLCYDPAFTETVSHADAAVVLATGIYRKPT